MTRWENHSGSAVSLPVVNRDIDAGDEVDVPDDVTLPANYFRLVDDATTPVLPVNALVVDATLDDGE